MSTPMVMTQAKPRAKPKFTAPRKILIDRLRIAQHVAAQKKGTLPPLVVGHASTSGIDASLFERAIAVLRRTSRHEDQRKQISQHTDADQRCSQENKDHKSQRMKPQEAGDFSHQAQDDESTRKTQKLLDPGFASFHCAGSQNLT